jgi:hypothetical protein
VTMGLIPVRGAGAALAAAAPPGLLPAREQMALSPGRSPVEQIQRMTCASWVRELMLSLENALCACVLTVCRERCN